MSKRSWDSYLLSIIKYLFIIVFVGSFVYLGYYALHSNDIGMLPVDSVRLDKWQYSLDGDNWYPMSVPGKAEIAVAGDQVTFKATLPDNVTDAMYFVTSSSRDMKVYIDGSERLVFDHGNIDIPGTISKNVYMFVRLRDGDGGKEIRIVKSGPEYNGAMTECLVGDSLSVTQVLKRNMGFIRFAMAIFTFLISIVLLAIGLLLRRIYRQEMYIIALSLAVMVTSAWLIFDSYLFQLEFGVRFIDGFLSYILSLIMVFPYMFYIDGMQNHRYRKIYAILGVAQFVNFSICTLLHLTRLAHFDSTLTIVDFILVIIVLIMIACTLFDIKAGRAGNYYAAAIGFIVFGILCIIEAIYINKIDSAGSRPTGMFVLIGLALLIVFAVIQQTTEIKEAEKMRQMIEESSKAKQDFLTNMSHEIRTPINTILGMNQMIIEESDIDRIKEYARTINHSGKHLITLINDILDFTLFQTGKEPIVNEHYNIKEMLTDSLEMLNLAAGEKKLSVTADIDESMPEKLCGDGKHIERVINNIISNAVKYTDCGGISFSASADKLDDDNYLLKIVVEDTGKGIRTEDIPHIFEPFTRADIKKNRSIEGTGMGLSISKELIERMGGSIELSSVYDKGSTFTITVPQGVALESEVESDNTLLIDDDDISSISIAYTMPNARILAVDDNNSNLIVVKEFLRKSSAQLDMATGGMDAIEMCNMRKYDIILMDHMMPDPDGIAALHAIKEGLSSLNRNTPILVLTANAVGDCKCEYIKEGFTNYLSKPIVKDILLKMIRKYISPNLIEEISEDNKEGVKEESALKFSIMKGTVMDKGIIDFEGLYKRFDGSEDTVNMVLTECVKEGNKKLTLLKELFDNKDIGRYAVEAHGVKGVMASICATEISERAKKHEFAGKENRVDFISEDLEGFLEEYGKVIEYINDYLGQKGIVVSKPKRASGDGASSEEIISVVDAIEEALDEFDADKALELIDKLYDLVPEDKSEIVDEVRQNTDDFQYDLAKDSLNKLL